MKYTFVSFSLGDTNAVNHLIRREYIGNSNGFFKVFSCPLNFLGNGSTVQLDFHDVGFLLTLSQEFHLSVGDDTDDFAVFNHFTEIFLDRFTSQIIRPFFAGFCESLLFALVPRQKKWQKPSSRPSVIVTISS